MKWCSQSWQCFPHVSKCQPLTYHGTKCDIIINIREHQRGNQKWTIQRNWQQSVHKTKRNKHQRNTIYATHRYAQTHTNNVNKTWDFLQTTGGNSVFVENLEDIFLLVLVWPLNSLTLRSFWNFILYTCNIIILIKKY